MSGPYDPPKSVVADAAPAVREKPAQVRRAVTMLWLSLGLGVANLLIEPRLLGEEEGWMSLLMAGVSFAIVAGLTAGISAGYNWARIVFLILFVIGFIPYLFILREMVALSAVAGVLSVVQEVLQFGALFLVFTKPGSLWFRKDR